MKFCLRRKAVSVREAGKGQKTAPEQRLQRNGKRKRNGRGGGSEEKRPVRWREMGRDVDGKEKYRRVEKSVCVGGLGCTGLVSSLHFPSTCLRKSRGGPFLTPAGLPTAPFVYSIVRSYLIPPSG